MLNDGTKLYDHQHDGSTQIQGSCVRDFRNKPFPIRLRIEYIKQALTVRYRTTNFTYRFCLFYDSFYFLFSLKRFISIMEFRLMIMHMNFVHILIESNYLKLVILV